MYLSRLGENAHKLHDKQRQTNRAKNHIEDDGYLFQKANHPLPFLVM